LIDELIGYSDGLTHSLTYCCVALQDGTLQLPITWRITWQFGTCHTIKPWASLYRMGWLNGIIVDCQKPLCTKWGGFWQLFWMYDFVGIVLHDVVSMFHEVHFAVVLAFASMHLC